MFDYGQDPADLPDQSQMLHPHVPVGLLIALRSSQHAHAYMQHARQSAPPTTAVQRATCCLVQVCGELVQRLIPGLSLTSPNPFLAAELWYLLELLPYSKRFEVYEDVSVRLLSQNSFKNSMTVNLGSSKTAILLTTS